MATQSEPTLVVEPEVLPPDGDPRSSRPTQSGREFFEAFGPILVGATIDAVDFLEHGIIGMFIGMFVAGTLAYAFTTYYRRPVWQRLLWAVGAGVYCLTPPLKFVPLGTIVGAAAQYYRGRK